MEGVIITIGVTLVKLSAVGGLTASIITGIKWFAKFDPKFSKGSKLSGGDSDESSIAGERVRKALKS